MEETQKTVVESNIFKEFMIKLLNNLLLLVIIVVLTVGGGVGYSLLKKPTYTAKVVINYQAELDQNSNSVDNISVMKDMLQSVVDLSVTEIVLEEANYLYDIYLRTNMSIDEFIVATNKGQAPEVTDFNDNAPHKVETKHFSPDKVSAKSLGETNSKSGPKYIYTLSVSDVNNDTAVKKARILALAGNRVSRGFFDGYTTVLDELEISVTSDISMVKNVLVSFLAGIALSVVIVYLKCLLDKTATSKEELERITKTTVIALIEDQEDK